jgi:hydrogenase maturation protease
VSLFDPPERWRECADACRNVGTWPVLVGAEGSKDTVLSSPIILYDYPQVAPESPGDFFDGTEMDEMLTLRILTMTDEEKRSMAAVDGRTAELLARTETAARDSLRSLHGTIRSLRPVAENGTHG